MNANKRCTFYINPGVPDFIDKFCSHYQQLLDCGFEIGSHSYIHQHLSYLSGKQYVTQLKNAKNTIEQLFNYRPTTFAFPHHDFDLTMLSQARNIYFETRNTLYRSQRFSLKTTTTLESVEEALIEAIEGGYSLVLYASTPPASTADQTNMR